MYLYLLRNTVNDKAYVGLTTRSLQDRLLEHIHSATHGGQTLLAKAIRKYGLDAFEVRVLKQTGTRDELIQLEQEAIQTYQTCSPHGYNLTLGGDGLLGFHLGVPKSAEQRQKMREAQLGEKNHRYGKPITEEHKQRLREFHTGKTWNQDWVPTEEQKQRLRTLWLGGKHSPEAKERIAASKRGKPRDDATKAKLAAKQLAYLATHANPMQGRTHSAETRQKIAAKATGRVGHKPSAENVAKLRAATSGGNNRLARAVEYEGHQYACIMDAVRATGMSREVFKRLLKHGEARYLDKKEL